MEIPWGTLVTIICTFIASSGFWTFIITMITNKQKSNSAERRMILGLGFAKICERCQFYISRGYITRDEYTDLKKYLYEPYHNLGGNGTCERLMAEVDKLPLKHD